MGPSEARERRRGRPGRREPSARSSWSSRSGSPSDSSSHTSFPGPASRSTWARSGSGRRTSPRTGLNGFYGRDFFHDYTPGYLYVLWLVGLVGNAARRRRRPDQDPADPGRPRDRLARLVDGPRARRARPAGADRRRPSPSSTRSPGSTASSGARSTRSASCSCCSALRELWRDRPERAAICTVIAAIIKPQLGDPHPDRRGRHDPARAVAGAAGSATRSAPGEPIRILTTGAGRVPDGGRAVPAVRAVGHRAQQPAAVPDVRPARPGRGRRRRLPVPDRQRLQPVGARARRTSATSLANAGAWVCDYAGTGPGRAAAGYRPCFGRRHPGGRGRDGPAAGVDRGHPRRRRPPPGPADAARRAGRPGPRLLRGPDPRPRALRLPVLRAGRDPGRGLVPLADRLHRPVAWRRSPTCTSS